MNLELLGELRCKMGHVHALPKFPAVSRDIAVVVDETVGSGTMLETIRKSGGKNLEDVRLFDIYRGTGIPEGKKSMAFSLELRSDDRTLTDADSEAVMSKVLAAVAGKLDAQLR